MASAGVLSSYIKKLNHPLKEIRERSLQLLLAKLRLGWELEDELSGTRELFEALLAWLQVQQPSLQREALDLLLTVIKTNSGTYIAKEIGIKKILSILANFKHKIDSNAEESYNDIMEMLKFLNTVECDDNINVPRLSLPSVTSSETEGISSSGCYNLGHNFQSSKETSISNEEFDERYRDEEANCTDGIKLLLFPWVELCQSDSKTMLLVEDALKLLKSTRRCCRFIRDVFLRDFPVEIFLNRPAIIQNLLMTINGAHCGRLGEALHVLLCVTCALCTRISQLTSLDLIHDTNTNEISECEQVDDEVNLELQQIAGDGLPDVPLHKDALAALRQLPAPIYALETMHTVLSIMNRNIFFCDPVDKTDAVDLKELNTCLSLVENLVCLLLRCVGENFWRSDHNSKTHRDIAHKSCMVMRLLGDILTKYRKSFLENPEGRHYRVAWLRLVSSAESLVYWMRDSPLPPTSLVSALQMARLDTALELFYPNVYKRINHVLENTRISVDQEHKSKHRELRKLFNAMEHTVQFMKNKNSCHDSKKVLPCIKNSIPALEIHMSDAYLNDIAKIILQRTKEADFNDNELSDARSIALTLMAHHIEWVRVKFYRMLVDMVQSVIVSDDNNYSENEKCLTLLCDVGILTEICCHGLSSKVKDVNSSASEVMLYLLRGRLVLSESCWWRLLASLLPVLPLLHVYAAHDTQLGQAICKSLECDIAECMGVSTTEVCFGLTRLLFVHCPAVRLDAAHALCRLLDDEKYLPPRELLRSDIIINALRRLQPQEFNIDYNSSPSKTPQSAGLTQILDVLKQDIMLDEHGYEFVACPTVQPTLEPSLRRSTLQQLSVMMRQQELHDMFIQCDGLKVILALLRMSLQVEDYLAFPECAISCVSVLNSICFAARHALAKISDLPLLLLRVILVFPANESAVLLSAQVLSLVSWAGFVLQELDASRRRVPALPMSVAERVSLPFHTNAYWNTSPNAEHSTIEWLLSDEDCRAAIRVRWWCAWEGAKGVVLGAAPPPAPLAIRPTAADRATLQSACPTHVFTDALLNLDNATSHEQVSESLNVLESYVNLVPLSCGSVAEVSALPWQRVQRFLRAPPASPRDAALLIALLEFILAYMDNIPRDGATMSWIKSSFIGDDATVISLLSREQFYPQQTAQETIEITQLHIHIVKVLLRCIVMLEHDHYDSGKLESLLKILFACLERVDLKNFHMLGYLNELVRCIRYALNCRYCNLSENTVVQGVTLLTSTLRGYTSGGGRKGQACRLDALLSLLTLLRHIYDEEIPVQRWSESWNSDVVSAVVNCADSFRPELRAASLYNMAALAHYAQLMPQLLQAVPGESLSQFATSIFSRTGEANVVRAAAASLLTAITGRASSHTDILENDVLEQLKENDFLENCLEILVEFCNSKKYEYNFEPNVPLSVLERRSEIEVRAEKSHNIIVSPAVAKRRRRIPPTASLVTAIAEALINISAFQRCPVREWNEQGLYRLFFRCVSWNGDQATSYRVRIATCRVLATACAHKCVRATLAATKDCLHNLLITLTPFQDDDNADCLYSRAQALLLLGSLLAETSASESVWWDLTETYAKPFFHLLLQCLESSETELQDAALYCLSQLVQSMATNKKHSDKTKGESYIEFFDNLQSPFIRDDHNKDVLSNGGKNCAGDSCRRDDCQPEYMAEELLKALIFLYQELSSEMKHLSGRDDRWIAVCSCVSSLLAASPRCRLYGVHRRMPRTLLATMQAVRDRLSLVGKPTDVIRNANNNPTLRTLYWLLTIMNCLMIDCVPAKENFSEESIATSLNRLWPWCMMTEQLRDAAIHLLLTFTNDCPKAWSSMCACVSGRCLAAEVCALAGREAARQSRAHRDALLCAALRTLRHCAQHHHCRAIILKNDVLSNVYKLEVRNRAHVAGAGAVGKQWAQLCEAVARSADGGAGVLALRPPLPRLLPALAHAAQHHRVTFLQSPAHLELLSAALIAGDVADVVSAARAVWALAANNHKAKLQLRSAGVVAAVQSALQRLQRDTTLAAQRALQLLTYTNTVLQTG